MDELNARRWGFDPKGSRETGTITATPEALQLIAEIVADHGPVLLHQSGLLAHVLSQR